MIDRGDLGAEIGDNDLYKSIIKITNEAKKEGKKDGTKGGKGVRSGGDLRTFGGMRGAG